MNGGEGSIGEVWAKFKRDSEFYLITNFSSQHKLNLVYSRTLITNYKLNL